MSTIHSSPAEVIRICGEGDRATQKERSRARLNSSVPFSDPASSIPSEGSLAECNSFSTGVPIRSATWIKGARTAARISGNLFDDLIMSGFERTFGSRPARILDCSRDLRRIMA